MRSMQIMKIKPPGTVNPPSGNPTCTNQNSQLVSQSRPCGFAVPSQGGIWAEQWCSGGMKLGTELRHRAGCSLCSFLGWLCSCSELDECFSKVWRPPMRCSWICCCWLSPLKQLIKETKIIYFTENTWCEFSGIFWERNSNCNEQNLFSLLIFFP